jgi:flagellin
MGSNQLVGTHGVTAFTAAAAVNGIAAGTLTVAGAFGSETVAYAAGDTARDIAAAVNTKADKTGVDAFAETFAILDVTATGGVSFTLNGQNEATADAVTVAANISDLTDLSELAKSINDVSGTTGISAVLSDDKADIYLENADGYDISLSWVAGGVTLQGSDETNTAIGAAATLTTGSDVTVAGSVNFDSSKSYFVTDSITGGVLNTTAAQASSLEAVSAVDISTQVGANNAINVIDGAIAFIDSLRGDLGAVQNRFESTIANLMNVSENISAAKSRIVDADFAAETAALTKAQILQQSGIAMLAQANTIPQAALTLLQG